MDKQYIKLQCSLDETSVEPLNSEFSKVKIRVAYAGKNRKRTILSKELLEKMSKTSLPNIPIVGYWREDVENFDGHSFEIKLEDGEVKYVDLTRPYGVIPTDTEVWWEEVLEDDGFTIHDYLCCTGILWTGRYPECEKIITDTSNQSMEINIIDLEYTADGFFKIKDAEFSALCILGKGESNYDDVKPCFESSNISAYSMDDFRSEFTQMVASLKCFSVDTQTTTKEDKVLLTNENKEKILAEFGLTLTDIDFADADDMTEDSFKDKVSQVSQSRQDYMLSARNLEDKLRAEVAKTSTANSYTNVRDFDDKYAYVCTEKWVDGNDTCTYFRIPYTVSDTTEVAIDVANQEEVFPTWQTADELRAVQKQNDDIDAELASVKEQLNTLMGEFEEYKSSHSTDNLTVAELVSFRDEVLATQRINEIQEVLTDFNDLEGNEEFEKIKASAEAFTDIEILEKECFALRGKIKAPVKSTQKPNKTVKIPCVMKAQDDEPYNGFFQLYK